MRLWDVASRQQKRVLVDSAVALTTLAYAHDHPWLAVDTHSGIIQVWDTDAGTIIAEVGERHENQHVDAIAFSPDDSLLAGTIGTGSAMLWKTNGWSLVRKHDFRAVSLAFVDDGSQLVLGSRDWLADIVGWNAATGQRVMHVGKLPTMPHSLVGMRNDEVLFAGSANGTLRAFRLSSDIQHVLPTGQARLQSLSLSPDDRLLASAGFDGIVRVWDFERNRWPVIIDSPEPISSAILSPDGHWLAINTTDHELFLWNCQTRQQVARLSAHLLRGFSASGRTLICQTAGGPTTAVEVPSLKPLEQVYFTPALASASISANDRVVALLSEDGDIEVTDLRQRKVVLRLPTTATLGTNSTIALTDDGTKLVVLKHGQLPKHAHDLVSGKNVPLPDDLSFLAHSMVLPQHHTFSPDGTWKLTIRDELVECYLENIRTGETRARLSHRDYLSTSRAWSTDGKRLFINTRIGELIVVDTATGMQLCELDTPLGRVASPIACCPDGERHHGIHHRRARLAWPPARVARSAWGVGRSRRALW